MSDQIQRKEGIKKFKIEGGEIMDTLKLFLQIKLDVNLLTSKKIKWNKFRSEKGTIYNCNYNGVRLVYYYNKFALTLETSVTKFLYGDNSVDFNLNNLDKLFKELDFTIRIATSQKIISVKKWTVTRLYLVNNYLCNNENDKMVYLNMLNGLFFSNCKKHNINIYPTSIHAHNKSIVYNMYSKSHENNSCDNRILRVEFQYKNKSLNRLKNTGYVTSKNFEDVISNTSSLNNIYQKTLCRLGLNKKFLTKRELELFLNKLYKNNLIKERLFRNMYNHFITESISISATTLNSYKKILSKYNYSHLLLDNRPTKYIDFLRFNLFDQTRPDFNKTNILYLLLLLLTIEVKTPFYFTKSQNYTNQIFNFPAFFDDG